MTSCPWIALFPSSSLITPSISPLEVLPWQPAHVKQKATGHLLSHLQPPASASYQSVLLLRYSSRGPPLQPRHIPPYRICLPPLYTLHLPSSLHPHPARPHSPP